MPVAPTGQTAGTSIQSQAAAWRIGDAEFIGAPGEVFPFTCLRGPVGPEDMNYPRYGMPPWPSGCRAGVIGPAQWMDLLGRPQVTPDRNTRGWIDADGRRHWLDVFADIAGQPASVTP